MLKIVYKLKANVDAVFQESLSQDPGTGNDEFLFLVSYRKKNKIFFVQINVYERSIVLTKVNFDVQIIVVKFSCFLNT